LVEEKKYEMRLFAGNRLTKGDVAGDQEMEFLGAEGEEEL
jgi:hypothetical protein